MTTQANGGQSIEVRAANERVKHYLTSAYNTLVFAVDTLHELGEHHAEDSVLQAASALARVKNNLYGR